MGREVQPLTVPRDSGTDFIDQNSRCVKGRSTLPPLIRAVQAFTTRKNKVTPKFFLSSVGFVADCNGLQKLIAWANNKYDRWRTNTQLAGKKTDLANCWSPVTKHTSGRSDPYGFEKACTHPTPVCESRTDHHRVVACVRPGISSE